ncbi:hypothetical protein Ddye_023851 [Dipteronia dyeriana]|uniref:Uncharacterized protein n=1 Tax=Dipteronia dyeriana TaxID=168575 RepID=A0AAD9TUC5_9ROSI|nr:hypothetical protein Ddye_023851 [Dipteronia dyeriana]
MISSISIILSLSYALVFIFQVLIEVKLLRWWPFLGRLRVCFVEPPYFQVTVNLIFHWLVTELPGIAGSFGSANSTAGGSLNNGRSINN